MKNLKNVTVIACKPAFPPYLAALNPTDQVFDFEELEYHYLVANRTEDVTSKGKRSAKKKISSFLSTRCVISFR